MRNLAEYPITNDEILGTMDTAVQRALDSEAIPNMSGLLMTIAFSIVQRGLRDEGRLKPVERAHCHRRLEDQNNKGADGQA